MNELYLVHILLLVKALCIVTLDKTHVIWQGSGDQVSNESERQWWSFFTEICRIALLV